MYLAEFALQGTSELASELLIQAPSESAAKTYAEAYAYHWGIELFSLTLTTEQQARRCRQVSKLVMLADR